MGGRIRAWCEQGGEGVKAKSGNVERQAGMKASRQAGGGQSEKRESEKRK
jgi:hypothetical protein